ncbi:MAG: hypothetical protein ACR2P2_02445 [Nakamurella sp.]
MNRYLQGSLGAATGGQCGMDEQSRLERADQLVACGFVDVTVFRHNYTAELTRQYIVGHLFSAMSETQVPVDRRADFEAGLLSAIKRGSIVEPLIEHVPVITLAATAPG